MEPPSDSSCLTPTPEPVEPRPRRRPYSKTRSGRRVHFEPGRGGPPLPFTPACKCKAGSGILKKKCDRLCGTRRSPRSATFNTSPILSVHIIPARGLQGIMKSPGSSVSKTKPLQVRFKHALTTVRGSTLPKLRGILKKSVETREPTRPRLWDTVAFQQPLCTIYEVTSDEEESFQRTPWKTRPTSTRKGLGLVIRAVDEYDMRALDKKSPADRKSWLNAVIPFPANCLTPPPEISPVLYPIEDIEEDS
ncbi:hypothetical protein F5X68DRAFT_234449 [Plectosphaerella plurivora]|uniref:Uncharacterized protein n=1 Tax=Plectosphaerella plurivora TaxID=936078 RepID=A0A9P8V4L5_9PEZI|nr:hypothetical protein F5X68DRAFT_234449 [Plectosphaerella plurivora]